MKTGFHIELSADELNVLITACSTRQRELSELIETPVPAAPGAFAGKMYLVKQHKELSEVLQVLRNARFFIKY